MNDFFFNNSKHGQFLYLYELKMKTKVIFSYIKYFKICKIHFDKIYFILAFDFINESINLVMSFL